MIKVAAVITILVLSLFILNNLIKLVERASAIVCEHGNENEMKTTHSFEDLVCAAGAGCIFELEK